MMATVYPQGSTCSSFLVYLFLFLFFVFCFFVFCPIIFQDFMKLCTIECTSFVSHAPTIFPNEELHHIQVYWFMLYYLEAQWN